MKRKPVKYRTTKVLTSLFLGLVAVTILVNGIWPNSNKAEFPAQTNCNAACSASNYAFVMGGQFAKDYGYCPTVSEAIATGISGVNGAWLKGCRHYLYGQ